LLITRRGAEDLATEFIDTFGITQEDRFLFFLPLSHFQQRLSVYMCLYSGTSVMHTPYTHVFHDIPRFQPTFLLNPPVFYETALATLLPRLSVAGREEKTLNAGFGGKVRFMITGMAPTRRNVLEAYQRLGVPLLEAYGITEVGSVTWNVPGDNRIGTVGRPLRNHRITLAADSEVLVRARNPLSKGYFEAEEGETERTFLPDGSIATGDAGEFVDGHLVLKGRKKDIIITGAGVKFHPAELEERILTFEAVKQAVVISDSRRGDVVAVMSVDDPHDSQLIASADRLVQQINDSMPTYKRIARTVLTRTRFTVDNGMLTRNLKPNRAIIARQFSGEEPYASAVGQ
jgi:long-subunit acyl-CoA synthetase (AMP-forming)